MNRDIDQQCRNLEKKQQSMTDIQSQFDLKQCELSARQQQRTERQQQLTTVQTALTDIRQKMATVDARQRTLERDIQQQATRKQESERLVQQNENNLRAVERDLERVTRASNDKQRVREQINKTCQNLASQAKHRRTAQTDVDRHLKEAQRKVNVCRTNTSQIAQKICAVDKDIKTKQATLRSNRHSKQDINEEEEEHFHRQQNYQYVQAGVSCSY
jgi:chromosome segregation ATPase